MGTVFCSHRSSKRSSPLLSFSSVVWPLGYMAVRLVWKLQRMLLVESTENLLLEMPEGLDHLRRHLLSRSLQSRQESSPEKKQKRKQKETLLNPVFLIPLSIMLLLVLDMVLVVVLFVGLGVFFLAKSR